MVYKKDKIYYPQVFWEECKYICKRKKEIPSGDSDRENSDAGNSNGKK